MKPLTCIVIGGGYAGIHAVKAIRRRLKDQTGSRALRLVLIDKNPYHLRKVLLFKPAVQDEEITVPLSKLFPEGVELVQAEVTKVETAERRLQCRDAKGRESAMSYDFLVLALGSVVRQPRPDQGGLALASAEAARTIQQTWRASIRLAATERDEAERRRFMTIAVAGAGISGIETAAELAYAAREEAVSVGLDPRDVKVQLYNSNERLFPEGSSKVSLKLEHLLNASGVTVIHRNRVVQEKQGVLTLSSGETKRVGLCVWTLGLIPNPVLTGMGVPLTPDGYVIVDECYRVQGAEGVYSIGDCARIVDSVSGKADGMTCKEATGQAARLGKILSADLAGGPAPRHKAFMDFYCFNLGPEQAMVWTRQWGLQIVIAGKLGARIRKLTWDTASLLQ